MEELIGALVAWIVRAVFGSQPAPRGRLAAPPTPPTTLPRSAPTPAAPSLTVQGSSRRPAATRPPAPLASTVAPSPETQLVTGLFATPQSLAAAIVASEVLLPPVALRPEGFSARASR